MSKGLGYEKLGQHRDTGHIPFGRSSNYVCRFERIPLKRDQLQHAGVRGGIKEDARVEETSEEGIGGTGGDGGVYFFGDLVSTRLRRSDECPTQAILTRSTSHVSHTSMDYTTLESRR